MIQASLLHSRFKAIIDEFQSDYFEYTLIDSYLNQAQLHTFKRLVNPDTDPNRSPGFSAYYETSQKIAQYLGAMVKSFSGSIAQPFPQSQIGSNVKIAKSTLETNLGRELYGIGALQVSYDGTYYDAKWKANAEHSKQKDMEFFKPVKCEPYFTYVNEEYHVWPSMFVNGASVGYQGVCLVMPALISLTPVVNSELHPALTDYIAYKAAELAGIAVRDQEIVGNIVAQIEKMGV